MHQRQVRPVVSRSCLRKVFKLALVLSSDKACELFILAEILINHYVRVPCGCERSFMSESRMQGFAAWPNVAKTCSCVSLPCCIYIILRPFPGVCQRLNKLFLSVEYNFGTEFGVLFPLFETVFCFVLFCFLF